MNDAAKLAIQRAREAEIVGALPEASAAYDEAIRIDPEEIGTYSAKGLFLGRQGRFFEAVDMFRRSTAIKPSYVDHYNTGNMLQALGRNDEAYLEYDAAVAVEPSRAEGWCNRGIALYALGRSDEARTSFDRAISLDDKLVNAYHCKAILLQKLGDKSAAVAARRRVTELAPSAAAFIDLANALRDGLGDKILWEPKGVEEQIVEALEAALALPCDRKQHVWCWAEKLQRLQRIAHGRQSARRTGVPIEDGPAILRYCQAAEQAFDLYPEDKWMEEKLGDAQLLRLSLPVL
ncbi:MAG: tetratricopeptide repeat protein [Deltaproteobacteria bacterium]|nr:tetratricopeptide repeat protein [Deltaproteobacteria bacterium]